LVHLGVIKAGRMAGGVAGHILITERVLWQWHGISRRGNRKPVTAMKLVTCARSFFSRETLDNVEDRMADLMTFERPTPVESVFLMRE
jgi:hypothetical protein